ncbi:hypothetical protein VKS41_003889 [Umbelopsis sp. WA50703]
MGAKASKQYQQQERPQHRQIKVHNHSRRTSPAHLHTSRRASLSSSCSERTLSSSSSSSVAEEFRRHQMPAAILPALSRNDYAIGDDNNISTVTASSSGFNSSDISALFSQIDNASSIASGSISSRATTVSSHSSCRMGDKFLPPPYSAGQISKDNYLQIINGLIPISSGPTNAREELSQSTTTTLLQPDAEIRQPHIQLMGSAEFEDTNTSRGSTTSANTDASHFSKLSTITSTESQPHQLSHEFLLGELRQQRKLNSRASSPIVSSITNNDPSAKSIQSILEIAFKRAQDLDDPTDYVEAYQATRCFADESNDPIARIWVAQCHLNGWGVPRNPTLAFQTLSSMARRNILNAYYPTGCCYYDGAGVPQDLAKAFYWFELAANCNEAMAQYRVGSMLAKGEGVKENAAQAFEWFKKGADNGNKYAQYIVGIHYEQGMICQKDQEKARAYYLLSADQKFPDSQTSLGISLLQAGEHAQGLKWLEMAAQKDNARALLKLGIMYEEGNHVEQNNELAAMHYKAAADRNDPVAQYLLGLNYRLGDLGLQQSYPDAVTYLQKSADQGFASAQRVLGLMYGEGVGVTQDYQNAIEWFKKAAEHGDMRANGLLGAYYENGYGVDQDYIQALDYYTKAASTGSDAAEFSIAQLLHKMRRYSQAYKWYGKAAKRGRKNARLMVARYKLHGWGGLEKDSTAAFKELVQLATVESFQEAYFWVAACYEEGGGIEKDLTKAFEFYMKSAESGDLDGEFQVALMLSNGQGVTQNRKMAFDWYSRAARKGHRTAQYSTGLYYAKGLDGVPQDLAKAQAYFEQATAQGLPEAFNSLAALFETQARYEEAIYWYKRGASNGDPVSLRQLAMMYDGGIGVSVSHEIAFKLFEKASLQRDAQSELMIGSYYEHGHYVDVDIEKSLTYYAKAEAHGAHIAPFAIAQILHNQGRYEEAYAKYQKAASNRKLANSKVGKTAQLMVSRYILSYDGPSSPDSPSDPETKAKAVQTLLELAESKFKPAYFWVGDCYYNGNGIKKDMAQAFKWLQKAEIECRDDDAKLRIAKMYKNGLGTEQDFKKAISKFESLVETSHQAIAQLSLGQIYCEGSDDVERDLETAKMWFTKAVDHKIPDATYMLGLIAMEQGDEEDALVWYERAIDQGHVPAMREFALAYQHGEGSIEQDLSKTSFWLQRAAQECDAEAMVYLGLAYEHGMGNVIFRNRDKAMQLYQDAAAMDNSNAMFLAAQMFHTGENYTQALELFESAAQMGKITARVMTARYSLSGLGGTPEDPEKGFKTLLECAEADCIEAYNLIGQCYELGLGTEQNLAEALSWYQKSANVCQDLEAMCKIARMYGEGSAVEQSHEEALYWYHQAAEAGAYPAAQYFIGLYHKEGLGGLDGDPEVAKIYFRKAADQGDARAMYELANILWSKRAYTSAMAYYEEAASCGVSDALRDLGNFYHEGVSSSAGSDMCVIPKDYETAFGYFLRASSLNDPTSTILVGAYYENGYFVNQDRNLALKYYKKAVELEGGSLADLAIGQLLHSDIDKRDEAIQWLVKAADHGNPLAELMVALYHLNGWGGVEQDVEYGFSKLLDMAEKGQSEAFAEVAKCYELGVGVEQDLEQAFGWWSEASAMEDDVESVFKVAVCHEYGLGTEVNLAKAKDLYQVAANMGYDQACEKLELLN